MLCTQFPTGTCTCALILSSDHVPNCYLRGDLSKVAFLTSSTSKCNLQCFLRFAQLFPLASAAILHGKSSSCFFLHPTAPQLRLLTAIASGGRGTALRAPNSTAPPPEVGAGGGGWGAVRKPLATANSPGG